MLHIVSGNTGAGKTTYSQKLQTTNSAVVFSIDEWNQTLFLADKQPNDGVEWFLERIERAEIMIKSQIILLEKTDVDSILDLGFAKFEHRQRFRQFAQQNKFDCQLHYLNVPTEIRKKRILRRNHDKSDTYQFKVSDQDFQFMETWFEPPQNDELKNALVTKE